MSYANLHSSCLGICNADIFQYFMLDRNHRNSKEEMGNDKIFQSN